MERFDPRRYPIVVRVVDGYLEISQPDLNLVQVRGKFDDIQKAEEIGKAVLDVMSQVTKKYVETLNLKETLPLPSYPKGSLARPSEPVLGIKEVASYLGVSQDTVRRMSNEGKLKPFMTQGGHRRFKLKEIERYLESRP